MRKHFLLLPCLGLMLILFSCKKENVDSEIPKEPTYENLIPKIKTWLDEQKNGLPESSAEKIESLKSNLSYGEIHLEKYKESQEFIVIPVLSGFKSANNNGKDPANFLVLVFDNQEKIIKGNIIQYISLNNQKAVPVNTFNKIYTHQNLECSGQFTILSITDYFQCELNFENGKLKSIKEQKQKAHTKNANGRVTDCIDWYEQTWYIYEGLDGNVYAELVSEIYVFTTCDGDCWQPRIANGRSLRVNCNDGGGGGGNGSGCPTTLQEGENALASITSTILSDGGSSTDVETGPDADGKITRPVVIDRHSIRYTFPGGTTAKYTLFFNGVLFKTTTNSAWKWDELNFSQIAMTEGGSPPCLSANVSAAVGVSISGDKTKANFTATISATLTVSCLFGYVIKTKVDNMVGEYPANEF